MGQFSKLACFSLSLVMLTACTSKFEDRDPDSQNTAGFSVDGNLNANEDLDKKLQQLENSADKIRGLLRAFRKLQNSQENYTQIDFLLDANDQLTQAPSRKNGDKYIREGHIKAKLNGIAPGCEKIDTRLETISKGQPQPDDEVDGIKIDGLIFSVRTCRSNNEYLPVATVTFTDFKTSLDFNTDNIRKSLVDILSPVIQVNANCTLTVDAQNVLSHGECTNLSTAFLDGRLLLENVVYDRYNETRFALAAKLFDNTGTAKGKFAFSIRDDGQVINPKMEKIEPTPAN